MGFKKRPTSTTPPSAAESPAKPRRGRTAKAKAPEPAEKLDDAEPGEDDEDDEDLIGDDDETGEAGDGEIEADEEGDGEVEEDESVVDDESALADDDFPDTSDFDDGFAEEAPTRFTDIEDGEFGRTPPAEFGGLDDEPFEEDEEDEATERFSEDEEDEEEDGLLAVEPEEEEEEEEEAAPAAFDDEFDDDFRSSDDEFAVAVLKRGAYKKPKKPVNPTNVDQYISTLAQPLRGLMTRLRGIVREVMPDAEETLKLGMPHFTMNGNQVAYLDAKRDHVNLGFPRGAHITSTHPAAPKLLQGTGPNLRYIKVFGPEDIKADLFKELLTVALRLSRVG